MKINLLCNSSHYFVLAELLKTKGIEIAKDSPYCLVESGLPIPAVEFSIVFDSGNPKLLFDFLDELLLEKEKTNIRTIIGKNGESFVPLQLEAIYYFEADGNQIYCRTKENRYEIPRKLYEIEKMLIGEGFVRINKSCIVNILMVAEIFQWFNGRLLLKLRDFEKELEVSRFYVKNFKDFLGL